jgi:hypothetical protein
MYNSRVGDEEAFTTLGVLCRTNQRKVVVLTLSGKHDLGSRSSWGVISMRSEPWGVKAKQITDFKNRAIRKEKWQCAHRLSGMNSLKEEAVWLIGPLLV